jgi:hypothetical protein
MHAEAGCGASGGQRRRERRRPAVASMGDRPAASAGGRPAASAGGRPARAQDTGGRRETDRRAEGGERRAGRWRRWQLARMQSIGDWIEQFQNTMDQNVKYKT